MKSDDEMVAAYRQQTTGGRVTLTAIDIPFGAMVDLALKAVGALLIASIVFGIPVGIVVALIMRAS